MKPWRIFILPGLAGLLGLLLAAELLTGQPAPPAPPMHAALPASSADIAMDDAISQWAGTVLARPLFNQTRRPDGDAAQQGAGLARLTAIIVTAGSRSAIFAADGQKPQIVPEGGEINGYTLRRISADTVELSGPAGTLTLHPQFPSPATPASSSAPASPSHAAPAATPSSVDYDNES